LNLLQTTLPWSECPTELIGNATQVVTECAESSESQYFWYRNALDISEDISDFDGIRWWMLICLAVSWVVVYLIIMKGIQESGKVVYFTALFPYVVMTIFFVRGLTLPGAGAGLAHMFYPKVTVEKMAIASWSLNSLPEKWLLDLIVILYLQMIQSLFSLLTLVMVLQVKHVYLSDGKAIAAKSLARSC
jgi:hypothetical protein